ncbi:hypothetical protein MNVI_40030 [Mycobacterium noviomagense]|uniref:Uncharacterized protein n=1 Tax=Mycobacterium noviomagense TaxID=459858 RepID=A0A7I7PJF2_9MYCO|nr:hypothetical protein [Mycobacterium noviomagense]ORB11697.1 hypothetical protein BST37_18615 [Mycobacterium noviomagense]BBY08685.1 hypothetical protein MNVI_40030 [Mycobacterium noviomagense]
MRGGRAGRLICLANPPRPTRAAAIDEQLANPYRRSNVLQRIHLVSALLMVPQSVTVTFMLVWSIVTITGQYRRLVRW